MITTDDIKNLSVLARIAISEEEEIGLAKDLDAILSYVGEVSSVATGGDGMLSAGDLRNVMRSDDQVYQGGEFREAILANAPRTEDGYLKVPKII